MTSGRVSVSASFRVSLIELAARAASRGQTTDQRPGRARLI
jgi:hypothetical protein